MLAHENCQCNCDFCAEGFCKCIFNDDMDFYWYMRHLLCVPTKLHSMTSRNLFKPRYMIVVFYMHKITTLTRCFSSSSVVLTGTVRVRILVSLNALVPYSTVPRVTFLLQMIISLTRSGFLKMSLPSPFKILC